MAAARDRGVRFGLEIALALSPSLRASSPLRAPSGSLPSDDLQEHHQRALSLYRAIPDWSCFALAPLERVRVIHMILRIQAHCAGEGLDPATIRFTLQGPVSACGTGRPTKDWERKQPRREFAARPAVGTKLSRSIASPVARVRFAALRLWLTPPPAGGQIWRSCASTARPPPTSETLSAARQQATLSVRCHSSCAAGVCARRACIVSVIGACAPPTPT